MLIKQNRIINLSKLQLLKDGTKIIIGVSNLTRYTPRLKSIGYTFPLELGDTVLPKVLGPVSRRNAEGYYEIHRDKEMETHYRMIEWTYKQWSGRDQTVEITESTATPYQRYPRTLIPPLSIEITVAKNSNELIIVSPQMVFSENNKGEIIHVVNLFLELFGECIVFDDQKNIIGTSELKRLNWEVLPSGKMPWEQRREQVKRFLDNVKGNNRYVIEKRLAQISKYEPDFTAVGSAGFNGYILFGFKERDIYVLESVHTNNATYVLGNNWEAISQLTKAQILADDLHMERIIHNKSWYQRIDDVLKAI